MGGSLVSLSVGYSQSEKRGKIVLKNAGELAEIVRKKGVSTTKVMEAYLKQTLAYNSQINAIGWMKKAPAREQNKRIKLQEALVAS